jgi:hypothetical protein
MTKLFILLLTIPTFCFGQNKLEGEYYNNFGDTLKIFESSYFLNINIDRYSNTYVGNIDSANDTLYLDRSLDLNSLRRYHSSYSSKRVKDSIISIKNKEEKEFIIEHQWRFLNPLELLRKNDTLFLINSDGKIDERKFEVNENEFRTYFIKTK